MKNSEMFKKIKSSNLPLYIWGCGEWGNDVYKFLKKNRVDIDGFVVDPEYFHFENGGGEK